MHIPWRKWKTGLHQWLVRTDLIVLLAGLAVVLGTWGFIGIADEVLEGKTQAVDEWVMRSLRDPDHLENPIGPHWLKGAARDITALGSFLVLTLVTLTVVIFLLLIRKYHALVLVLVATVGGGLLSTILKELFDRARPPAELHLTDVSSTSFPSGHSMLSAVVYLTLGALLARLVEKRGLKLYCILVALFLTFLVGLSRIYLGVHYPTDVLAGWSAGLVWAVSCWLVARYLQHHGAVERNIISVENSSHEATGSDRDGGEPGHRQEDCPAAG